MAAVQTNWVALFGSFVLLCTLILTTYAGGAAVAVDGKMVDKPVLLRAEALLRAAG